MRRTLTILVAGLLVAGLAIGGIVPAVSAHGDSDTEQSPNAEPTDAENATEAQAASIAQWMKTRMGPEGIEAFEQQTGVSIEAYAYAMAEQMDTHTSAWNESTQQAPYSSGWNGGYQAPGDRYGPQMPHGPQMPYGPQTQYGPQMPCGGPGQGMYGGQSQGFFGGFGFNNGFGPWSSGPGGQSGGGHGMGGHGMGGHGMGGGW